MPFINPIKKINCPFCVRPFHLSELERRSLFGPPQSDLKAASFLSIDGLELNRMVTPPTSFSRRMVSRVWVSRTQDGGWKPVCPHCHMDIPHAMATSQVASHTIALIGVRNSGKSNYLGVLTHWLGKRFGPEADFQFQDLPTFDIKQRKTVGSWHLWRERYRQVVDNGQVLTQTPSGTSDLRIPLLFRLTFPKSLPKRLISPIGRHSAADLVLFDAAGEDLCDPEVMSLHHRYVRNASGLIFLIDPFELPGVREQLPPALRDQLKPVDSMASEGIDRVIELYEKQAAVHAGTGTIRTPIAVVFTKADLFRQVPELVERRSPILRDSQHRKGFAADDCHELNDHIISCMQSWGAAELVSKVRGRFRTSSFFALSSLGHQPDANGRVHRIEPMRIADPLLWLMWQLGHLRTARRRKT